jgi:hypothetical protein
VEEVIVDGRHIHAIDRPDRDLRRIELDLDLESDHPHTVEVRYVFDLGLDLPPPELRRGVPSRRWRLIDRWWEGADPGSGRLPEACRVILEGRPGSEVVIECLLPGRSPKEVEGAEWVDAPRRGMGRLKVTFPDLQISTPGCAEGGDEGREPPPCYVPVIVRVGFS